MMKYHGHSVQASVQWLLEAGSPLLPHRTNTSVGMLMAGRHNRDLLMQSKSNYVAVLGTREDSVGSTSTQILRTK